MKKLAAILLLLLFLFNLVGYRLWFNYVQQQSDIQLTASLDKHQYNDADLISIKVPLSMPYQTTQSNYERVDGEIKIDGKIYKYVKRRIVNGELELLCLPDHNKMRLQSAKNDFFKTTNDIATDNSSKKSDNGKTNVFKNLSSDYEQQVATFSLSAVAAVKAAYSSVIIFSLSSTPHTPPGQPPDAA
ncbi:hypothetical protein FC093_05455 [Ilyomonas limi]|uniref:Uncharacterized protein n=1 Tax=Ilyomonas limi TaxID=2575867 RepID=A0A4U3L918_9BACT|nr:hypothetical protein [Ilyomonas limi]TKK70197.1 hypothetical protein FC093_05455 [Ilyomonas limi]